MRKAIFTSVITLALATAALSQQPPASKPTSPSTTAFAALDFLVGSWEAEPAADNSSSHFTFAYDVDGSVLVRRNHAEYPATATRPANKHDDLLVIFRDPETKFLKANYWDNEDHIIHYSVASTAEGVDFVSDSPQGAPGFRLRYKKLSPTRVAIDFEIAHPGKPGAFAPYLSGTARKVQAAK